jgi:hypothetical protein
MSALAAKGATSTIPIVIAASADAVTQGIVTSLARPGGNVTGVTKLSSELMPKRLEILKEAVPRLSKAAVLWCPEFPTNHFELQHTRRLPRPSGFASSPLSTEHRGLGRLSWRLFAPTGPMHSSYSSARRCPSTTLPAWARAVERYEGLHWHARFGWKGREPPPRLYLARMPPHVGQPTRDGRRGSAYRPAPWRLAHAGDGSAIGPSCAGPPARSDGTARGVGRAGRGFPCYGT